jgi:hypothetical protein
MMDVVGKQRDRGILSGKNKIFRPTSGQAETTIRQYQAEGDLMRPENSRSNTQGRAGSVNLKSSAGTAQMKYVFRDVNRNRMAGAL